MKSDIVSLEDYMNSVISGHEKLDLNLEFNNEFDMELLQVLT